MEIKPVTTIEKVQVTLTKEEFDLIKTALGPSERALSWPYVLWAYILSNWKWPEAK